MCRRENEQTVNIAIQNDEVSLAAEQIAQPARYCEDNAVGHEVRRQRPGCSSLLDDRLPAMCGSATLTIVVSRTSMNAASVTATAISHGLLARLPGGIRICARRCGLRAHLTVTVGSADIRAAAEYSDRGHCR